MDIERRFVVAEAEDDLVLEDRANGQTAIVGYAAVYNRLSVDLGGFREEILPGAFDKVLNRQRGKADVLALVNHDSGQILGRTSSGTLELSSTEKGLRYVVTPPDTQIGRDTVSLLRRGDLRSSSFAFTVSKAGESFRTSEDGKTIRQIREVSGLYDVSVVTTPAYPDSSAAVSLRSADCEVARRSYEAWLAEQQQPEQIAVRSVMSAVAASVASLLRLKLHG
ncbi:MAG: HK97 family phage prohead protease [Gammaproteobacteria bacterium]|jgi:HK97 family phage prohead protease